MERLSGDDRPGTSHSSGNVDRNKVNLNYNDPVFVDEIANENVKNSQQVLICLL